MEVRAAVGTTNYPMGAIARSVGYSSEYAFNRAFARRHGVPGAIAPPPETAREFRNSGVAPNRLR